MASVSENFIVAMWLIWAIYWWALSRRVKVTTRSEPWVSRLSHILPLVLVAILIAVPSVPIPVLGKRFLPLAAWPSSAGAVVTALGLLFAVWARLHIGSNWSGIVTIKQGHELVTSGPYALVRHPIYSGLLLGVVGTAIALAEWRGVLAVAIATWALWRKLRLEEQWMRQQFGEAYQTYSNRVAAMVPFVL